MKNKNRIIGLILISIDLIAYALAIMLAYLDSGLENFGVSEIFNYIPAVVHIIFFMIFVIAIYIITLKTND
ncbi:hypothetical protein LJC13_02785 [Peptostreptococcaceae bacterium OttesenSCG-928-C18]|nr:hypothetical protein [Peptostreptococcaceae bacterium OttesenSCG-928-C18]